MKTITVELSTKSISEAIAKVKKYKKNIESKKSIFFQRVAELGAVKASDRFGSAQYDGDKDVTVSVAATPIGYEIIAQGQSVCFIEFGAGVFYNGSGIYPSTKPPGIVGIGEYGLGMGKMDTWNYIDGSGNIVSTHGNLAAMPMWYATEEMRGKILAIAQEVFRSD